jgi:hypothetical protein
MLDLEQSISDWRKQMLAAGIQTPVPLDELEIHLREEIERQMKSGLNEQESFKVAARQIGHASALKNEFQKANLPTIGTKRISAIAAGVITASIGVVMLCFAAFLHLHEDAMDETILCLGLILVFDGAGIICLASKRSFLASKHKA